MVDERTNGADLNKFAYAYDTRNVRTAVQMQYGSDPLRQVNYSYDSVDQLVGENALGGTAGTTYGNAYSYDAMGNRLRRENTQGTTTALTRSGVNELNQLTSVSTSVDGGPHVTGGMTYDAAGNLMETTGVGGARTLYVYDDADRLFRIEKRDAADAPVSKSEFVYDYASRKAVSQEFTFTAGAWVQSSEKRRVFDGMDVVQERDELNQVTAQLVRDGNIGGILARSTAAGVSFYGYDGGGNVTLLTDASGSEVGRYRYDAFGNTLEIAGVRAAENPYRFSTKELHAASGLYDYGYRFYSTGLGRWINRDPIREAGGVNLYGFVENNPSNNVDMDGLLTFTTKGKTNVTKKSVRSIYDMIKNALASNAKLKSVLSKYCFANTPASFMRILNNLTVNFTTAKGPVSGVEGTTPGGNRGSREKPKFLINVTMVGSATNGDFARAIIHEMVHIAFFDAGAAFNLSKTAFDCQYGCRRRWGPSTSDPSWEGTAELVAHTAFPNVK